MNIQKATLSLLLVAAASGGAARAQEFDFMPYHTAGYTGTVDDDSRDTARILWGAFTLNPGLAVGRSATMKYRVLPAPGIYLDDQKRMTIRYRDPGGSTRIKVRLYEYDHFSGATRLRLYFNSDNYNQSSSAQVRTLLTGAHPGWEFDFFQNSYYLQASIEQTAAGSPGTLYSMKLWSDPGVE